MSDTGPSGPAPWPPPSGWPAPGSAPPPPAPGHQPGHQPVHQPGHQPGQEHQWPGPRPAVQAYAPAPRRPVDFGRPAAHKPGAVPLRPLNLGDLFDSAFKIVRANPGPTVGAAVLVAAVSMALPVLVTVAMMETGTPVLDPFAEAGSELSREQVVGLVGPYSALVVGALLQALGMLFVTGMTAKVTAAAAVGHRLRLGEAWATTRGKRWRLVALSALLWLMTLTLLGVLFVPCLLLALAVDSPLPAVGAGLLGLLGLLVLAPLFWIRVYYLAVPALMLEDVGVLGALRRAAALTRRAFWRTLGIALLCLLAASLAGQIVGVPFGVLGALLPLVAGPEYAVLGLVLGQSLATIAAAGLSTPFVTVVANLQYLDQRMRTEAYAVVLMEEAGLTRP